MATPRHPRSHELTRSLREQCQTEAEPLLRIFHDKSLPGAAPPTSQRSTVRRPTAARDLAGFDDARINQLFIDPTPTVHCS